VGIYFKYVSACLQLSISDLLIEQVYDSLFLMFTKYSDPLFVAEFCRLL